MRLLNVIGSMDPASGGPAAWIRDFTSAARSRGHLVETVCFDAGTPPEHAAEAGVHVVAAGPGLYSSPALDRWLADRARGYDCLVGHGLWRYPSHAAWRARRRGGPPYLLYPHGALGSWFKRRYPLKHVGKCLYWATVERRAYAGASRIIYTCEQELRDSLDAFPGMDAEPTVSPLGIPDPSRQIDLDSAAAAFRSGLPALGGSPYVLWLGRIHPVKGCDLLLHAFGAAAPADMHLVMAGPDPRGWGRMLARLAQDLGIAGRVHWTGMLTGEAKWGAFRGARLFALPSHQENFGISAVEALACGVPVLVSDKVGICHELADTYAGEVAGNDAAGITSALRRCLDMDPVRQLERAGAARRLFVERFEVGRAADGLLRVAAEVAAGG